MIQKSPSSLSVRSIGIGEIERVSTADLSSPAANHVVVGNEEESSFVVRNFRALKSKWLHHDKPVDEKGLIENDTIAIRTDSSSMSEGASEDTVPYDLTTDLAYHNSSEREGADLIYRALTPEEQSAMPDSFMPLRHYRAEKVGLVRSYSSTFEKLLFMFFLTLIFCFSPYREMSPKQPMLSSILWNGEKNFK